MCTSVGGGFRAERAGTVQRVRCVHEPVHAVFGQWRQLPLLLLRRVDACPARVLLLPRAGRPPP